VRAVWSFWSKPFDAGHGWRWRAPVHHLLAWGLSLRLAQSHYPQTSLITDTPGRRLLVEQLGLEFTHMSTELDRLADAEPALWTLGKLVAYSLQDEPFVHLDGDVFLWRPLPDWIINSPVFAQSPEDFHAVDAPDGPRPIEDAFARAGVSLPAEWVWARSLGGRRFREANCGILGGTNAGFLRHYAALALDLALNPLHAPAWAAIADPGAMNTAIEQFFLLACLGYHRFNPESPYRGVSVRYLFPSAAEAYSPENAARVGYTHLLGPAKQNEYVTSRLAERVCAEDPDFYERCLTVSGHVPDHALAGA
jgi:Family of unknown function (DUF6734)